MNLAAHIEALRPWLESSEMAIIGLNGGFELTLRDRLLLPLQLAHPDLRVWSEFERADVALLDTGRPVYIAELKHNFSTQPDALRRLQADIEKQRGRICPCQFVQVITTIIEGPADRKYGGRSVVDLDQLPGYFEAMQSAVDPSRELQHLTFEASVAEPYAVHCRFDAFVISRGAKVDT